MLELLFLAAPALLAQTPAPASARRNRCTPIVQGIVDGIRSRIQLLLEMRGFGGMLAITASNPEATLKFQSRMVPEPP